MREPDRLAEFRQSMARQSNAIVSPIFIFPPMAGNPQLRKGKSIQIIGIFPIFVAFDSAETWAHPNCFTSMRKRLPTVVAGVPPDYFSPTGQFMG